MDGRESIRHVSCHAFRGRPACSPNGPLSVADLAPPGLPLPELPPGVSWCPECVRRNAYAADHGSRSASRQSGRY